MKKKMLKGLLVILVGYMVIRFIIPPPVLIGEIPFSKAIYDRTGHLLRLTLSPDDKYRLKVSLDEVSQPLVEAILLQEDQYFYWHFGVNPVSIIRAVWETYIVGESRIGASTITMQAARLRWKIRSKTFFGKVKQIIRAVQLEIYYSKKEILEAYLNLLPYGHNIEGVGGASLIYFGKNPDQLTLKEALTLCVIPQRPLKRRPEGGKKQKEALLKARDTLFTRWLREYPEDKVRMEDDNRSVQIHSRADLPFLAPHFVNTLIEKDYSKSRILSTLDLSLQKLVERHTRHYVERKKKYGVQNASVLLVHRESREILACLGSVDFFNKEIQGQVNGTTAKRSPGSTLKPFIYALAMDQGLIHPLTVVKDSPTQIGSYSPENFDGDFSGPITVKDALIRSRNVPAIRIANQLKDPDLYDFLKSGGIKNMLSRGHYGLALVLGGGEISMVELIQLYTMLGDNGFLKPLESILKDDKEGLKRDSRKRLLSPEASFMTLEILKDNPRPNQDFRKQSGLNSLPVYWKTGTSIAFRDAWAVGLFGPYAIVVWIGNFDGHGNPAFVGRDMAAPLMFEIIDSIKAKKGLRESMYQRVADGKNLTKMKFCAVSGRLPTALCPNIVTGWYIPGKSPIHKCQIHREVLIDRDTGYRSCGRYSKSIRSEVFEFWPSDLLKLFKKAGIPRRTPPPYDPRCSMGTYDTKGQAPQIVSPLTHVTYHIRQGTRKGQKIPLMATTEGDVQKVYWFVNESYLGRSKTSTAFLWAPRPGRYVIRAVDGFGRSDTRKIVVTRVR